MMDAVHGMEYLKGAVDNHVHACPHLNARSLDVFTAVRQAAACGMRGLGLMDNFANSAGYAALAMRELGDLGVDVFGGLIMEPPAGGVSVEAVEAALGYGYGPGTAARFISLPTHHTRFIARLENRSPLHIEACLEIPESGPLPEPLPAILDRVAAADIVLNTGHLGAGEALRLVDLAKPRGVTRILVPATGYPPDLIADLAAMGAVVEFSFFFVSHATEIGLTHVDAEKNRVPRIAVAELVNAIRAAGVENSIANSDAGVFVLPPPVEALREFLLLLEASGFSAAELRTMSAANPAQLFRVRQ